MPPIIFDALGTQWRILFDESFDFESVSKQVIALVQDFENTFSRFKPSSLVSKYNADASIPLNSEFFALLAFGTKLQNVSEGHFSCAVGKHLGEMGYGQGIQGIDFGAFGKGRLIDIVSEYLKTSGYSYFLVNAGGDIFATQKASGKPWTVALEHPKEFDTAIGTVELQSQALAASSPFKRSWNSSNHLIDLKTGTSILSERSVFTLAQNAQTADGLATLLNIVPLELVEKCAEQFDVAFLILEQEKVWASSKFSVTLF